MSTNGREPRVVLPSEGRRYDMGRMQAVFFADGDETGDRSSVSEWWLEPRTPGPGEHAHPEDHIYRVLTGTLSLPEATSSSPAARPTTSTTAAIRAAAS